MVEYCHTIPNLRKEFNDHLHKIMETTMRKYVHQQLFQKQLPTSQDKEEKIDFQAINQNGKRKKEEKNHIGLASLRPA
jgi:hypothetical protein